jgi:hypothetical protein
MYPRNAKTRIAPDKETYIMSWNPALDPDCPTGDAVDAIETSSFRAPATSADFEVRRALPAPKRQMVGPFIFFDQMGPAEFLPGQGMDVRPHPHIGLATISYLFAAGCTTATASAPMPVDRARRGELDGGRPWHHPFRTHRRRDAGDPMPLSASRHGSPCRRTTRTARRCCPCAERTLPVLEGEGKAVRLILGTAYGERAPVETASEMFYADAVLSPVRAAAARRARGPRRLRGRGLGRRGATTFEAGQMMVFRPGDRRVADRRRTGRARDAPGR